MAVLVALTTACGLVGRSGPTSITPEQVRVTDAIWYEEACGDDGGAGVLVDFDPDWEAVMGLLPSSTRSIWAAPDGYIASSLADRLTVSSVVAKFRLDEGRVILCD